MKNLFFLALLLIGCSPKDFSGFYVSEDCGDYSVDCFKYNFGAFCRFTYYYSHSVLGEISLQGTYYVIGDTLFLKTDPYVFSGTTHVDYSPSLNDKIVVSVGMIPKYVKNNIDTMFVPWLISVNNSEEYVETDGLGCLTLPAQEINSLTIRNYAAKFFPEKYVNADTTIYPDSTFCNINIYLKSDDVEPPVIPPVEKFIIGRKKITAIKFNESPFFEMFYPSTKIYIKN